MSYALPLIKQATQDVMDTAISWFSIQTNLVSKFASSNRARSDAQILAKGHILAVQNPYQQSVECLQGCLWITQDGDTQDIILEAGQNYVAKHNSRMLIYALETVTVKVRQ